MDMKIPFLLSLGGHSKQAGNKGHLPHNLSLFHAVHLPLANPRRDRGTSTLF